jgi:hypothetical protein
MKHERSTTMRTEEAVATKGCDSASLSILGWLARIGAGSAVEVALGCGVSTRVAQRRLAALEQRGEVSSRRLLHGSPALYVLTRSGLRAAGRAELEPVLLSAGVFAHALAVARVAVALETAGHRVGGERELRAFERLEGRPLVSAEVGFAPDGGVALHRPDLVCWDGGRPVAIEVELTVKAPARLAAIVRGWARSRLIDGVVYYATPAVTRALARALRSEAAGGRIAVLALDRAGEVPPFRSGGQPAVPALDRAGEVPPLDPRVPSQVPRSVGPLAENPPKGTRWQPSTE